MANENKRKVAKSRSPLLAFSLQLACIPAMASLFILGSKIMPSSSEPPLRDQPLPLFEPHMKDFNCEPEARHLPLIDAQAEAWLLQARALDSAHIFFGDRDYKRMVDLTKQAAQRHHWKALLNLASYHLEGLAEIPSPSKALELVEQGMKLGILVSDNYLGR